MTPENTYAVILAGGSGRRFWPLSRDSRPKQLLKLFGETTLLQQALSRLDGLVARENILVLTNKEQEAEVRSLLGDSLPAANIVAEPAKRDTAPAIALGIGWVAARNPGALMAVLPADHLIRDEDAFRSCLRSALEAAEASQALVTIGIKPTWACPGYGYIERGDTVELAGLTNASAKVYNVRRFREKPSPEVAEEFLRQGNFSWNAGMFIWSVKAAVAELEKHQPALAAFVGEVRASEDLAATLNAKFGTLPQISVDFALMEKADRVLNLEATFDWDDVGSWISVGKYLPGDEQDNVSNQTLTQLDSKRNIVFSTAGKNISLLGVEDLIVVQTEDALLVANRHSADAIKKIVDLVPKELH